jgi:4-nitrophenyl phosphatase
MESINALILDMDGVLWRDNQPIGDLPAVFSKIQQRGWRVTLATNNATLSVEQYLEKLAHFGVKLAPEQIVNSTMAVVHYLSQRNPHGGGVYVVGESSLILTLAENNFKHNDKATLAVIVGMDRGVTYEKLRRATLLIRSGVPFIGTNPDKTFPTPEGLVPGAGAIVAAVEAATSVQPIIVGKPSPEMYLVAMERMGVSPDSTVVVGDRLETDIAGGQQLGCRTGLVLSGVTGPQAARAWTPAPDWVEPDLTALLDRL